MQALFTIGYEKADPRDFLETLKQARIDLLIDVRERAMSRRKGFAKTALREGLASVDIGYRHEPKLGSPSPVRNELRESNDYPRFFRKYDAYLESQASLLDELAVISGRVVLMCYERAPCECHRTSVAREFQDRTGLDVRHLGVKAGAYEGRKDDSRSGVGKSLSPA